MKKENPEEWLTATQAGALKGVHRNTIAAAVRDGELTAMRMGDNPKRARYVIRRSDLDKWQPGKSGRPKKAEG